MPLVHFIQPNSSCKSKGEYCYHHSRRNTDCLVTKTNHANPSRGVTSTSLSEVCSGSKVTHSNHKNLPCFSNACSIGSIYISLPKNIPHIFCNSFPAFWLADTVLSMLTFPMIQPAVKSSLNHLWRG